MGKRKNVLSNRVTLTVEKSQLNRKRKANKVTKEKGTKKSNRLEFQHKIALPSKKANTHGSEWNTKCTCFSYGKAKVRLFKCKFQCWVPTSRSALRPNSATLFQPLFL
jgi:hypothetical protein